MGPGIFGHGLREAGPCHAYGLIPGIIFFVVLGLCSYSTVIPTGPFGLGGFLYLVFILVRLWFLSSSHIINFSNNKMLRSPGAR